ncbi:glycosyltransferase family 2 protein [Saccharopolyspora taberi]|uniref:Glycosyltransferase 2-like domain-containing protein n=1 Tax=Saccharopolyspora taberi TaxID=60895 RepID=A0ABN3VBJ9_9PSEU
MFLSVVIPCFNEERTLPRLRDALASVLPGIAQDREVILVDDGSTDRTLEEVRRWSAVETGVRYVSLSRNFGKESAILAGLRHARGDRIAIMDADLQHPPELLHRMLPLLESGYDQVVARRDRRGEPLLRSMVSRLYYRLLNRLADVNVQDGAGDFRVLSRRAVDAVLSLRECNRFSKGLFSWIGFDTAAVSFRNVTRQSGRSKWSVGKLVNYGIDGLLSFNNKPLRLSIYLGLFAAVLSCGYVGHVVLGALSGGERIPGYTTLVAGVAVLGGMQLLFLGVIGEYLGRIYLEVKRRPHFFVKESGPELMPVRQQRLKSVSRVG